MLVYLGNLVWAAAFPLLVVTCMALQAFLIGAGWMDKKNKR